MSNVKYGSIEELTADVVLSAEEQKKIDALDVVIQRDPNNLLARMLKGFLLYQAQADGQAIKEFNEVLARDPQYVDAYVWLAELLLFHWADAESAIPLLVKAKEITPQRPSLRSKENLAKHNKTTAGRADVYYLLAVAFQKQNNAAQFVNYIQRAIELEPTWIKPRICLIDYFVDTGQNDAARRELQELEMYMEVNFPVPNDEMELYYEELITGRVMTDYAREQLKKLKSHLLATSEKDEL